MPWQPGMQGGAEPHQPGPQQAAPPPTALRARLSLVRGCTASQPKGGGIAARLLLYNCVLVKDREDGEDREVRCVTGGTAVKKRRLSYEVVLEPSAEGGFTVFVPSLRGCVSEGETEEDALDNIKDAIATWLDAWERVAEERGGGLRRVEIAR